MKGLKIEPISHQIQEGPVFVVGMNGSGTTMLADSLGRHSKLYMLPLESKVLPYFIRKMGRYGDLSILANRRRLSNDLGRCKAYWQANGQQNVVVNEDHLGNQGLAGVIDGMYRHFAAKEGKTRWGDKSPINTVHIAALSNLFPSAQFIHIVRDGRDAAQSFHRRWGFNPLHTITRWKRTVLAGNQQGCALGDNRYIEIKYESLTSDPEGEMQRICGFLGLEFEKEVMRSSMEYMDPNNANANSGSIVANSEKWRKYFTAKQVGDIESIAGKTLADFGYAAESFGDVNPGVITRCIWLLKDGISISMSFFRQYGFMSIPLYLRHVRDAVKQIVAGMQ